MAAEHFSKGNELFVDEEYDEALKAFTAAIAADAPVNAEYYIKRSATHAKLGSFTESLEDANAALALEPASAKAFLRKG